MIVNEVQSYQKENLQQTHYDFHDFPPKENFSKEWFKQKMSTDFHHLL